MLRVLTRRKSVSPIGFEPITFGSGGRRSIQLSYGDKRSQLQTCRDEPLRSVDYGEPKADRQVTAKALGFAAD